MDNAQKIMVNSPSNSEDKGRTVEIAKDIPSNDLESRLGADVYADFPTSKTQAFETYSNRMDALVGALGNKDSAKG